MKFATPKQETEFDSVLLNQLVKLIALEADAFAKVQDHELTVTSVWRSHEEDMALEATGIHPSWRAVDVLAPSWHDPFTQSLANHVNDRYRYDPLRPWFFVALYAPHASATGSHIHFQVCDRTKPK